MGGFEPLVGAVSLGHLSMGKAHRFVTGKGTEGQIRTHIPKEQLTDLDHTSE